MTYYPLRDNGFQARITTMRNQFTRQIFGYYLGTGLVAGHITEDAYTQPTNLLEHLEL